MATALRRVAALLLLPLIGHAPAWGQCQLAPLVPVAVQPGDRVGQALHVVPGRLLVGAPRRDEVGPGSGAAYVYRQSAGIWLQAAKLLPSVGAAGDRFGAAVAQNGGSLFVGAPESDLADLDAGAVFVFQFFSGSWVQTQVLLPPTPGVGANFGGALAVSGGVVVIGAEGDNATGGAYVYELMGSTWVAGPRLGPPGGAPADAFGRAVTADGERIVVGSSRFNGATTDEGAAYLYERSGGSWSYVRRFTAGDPGELDAFGIDVALDGNVLVVGAEGDDPLGPGSGSAYVFEYAAGGWSQVAKLQAQAGGPGDRFGGAVDLRDGWIAVGARGSDLAYADGGAVQLFRQVGAQWLPQDLILSPSGAAGDAFGRSLALWDDHLAVGSPLDGTGAASGGAAHLSVLPRPLGSLLCQPQPNSTGEGAWTEAYGSALAALGCVELRVQGLPPGEFGYFFMAETIDFVPAFGGSQGLLCLGSPQLRFSQDILLADPSGHLHFEPDATNLPQGATFDAGRTWHFQLWYRDQNPTITSNTSSALSLFFH